MKLHIDDIKQFVQQIINKEITFSDCATWKNEKLLIGYALTALWGPKQGCATLQDELMKRLENKTTRLLETPITSEEIERRGFDPKLYMYQSISYMDMTINLDDIMHDATDGVIYAVGRYIPHGFINIARLESTNPDKGHLYYTSNKRNRIADADIEKKMHADIRAERAYPYKGYKEGA